MPDLVLIRTLSVLTEHLAFTFFLRDLKISIMNRLVIVFVAVFVAVVAAAPNVKVVKLKPFEHVRRAATKLTLLAAQDVQSKRFNKEELKEVMTLLDTDGDGMLNGDELKTLLRAGGTRDEDLNTYASTLLTVFDLDKNGKLDINETETLATIAGM